MQELRPLGDELHDDPEDGWWGEESEGEAEAAAEFVRVSRLVCLAWFVGR